jgi:zinc protease
MKTVIKKLKNGMNVILHSSTACDVVALQCWCMVGSADEKIEEGGVAHVLEHMMFKGTKNRKVGEVVKDIERVGGNINAWTSIDETVYHVTLPSNELEKGLDVISDAVLNSSLNKTELAKELKVILEEIRMGDDAPDRLVYENLFSIMFKDHPYGRPVIGVDRVVGKFDRKIVKGFYSKHYNPQNLFLVVTGNFNPETIMDSVEDKFGGLPATKRKSKSKKEKKLREQKSPRVKFVWSPTTECSAAIGFEIPKFVDEDVAPLDILASLLGQGASSRLETTVCRQMGLASEIGAMAYTPKQAGMFCVFAKVPMDDVEKFMEQIGVQLSNVTRIAPSSKEIEKAKKMLLSEDAYSLETVDGQARKLGYNWLLSGDIDYNKKYRMRIKAVTGSDLVRVAKMYLDYKKTNLSVVFPDGQIGYTSKKKSSVFSNKKNYKQIKQELLSSFKTGFELDRTNVKPLKEKGVFVKTLSSGDTLIVKPVEGAKTVAARAALFCGQRNEEGKKWGVTSLLGALLTRGTKTKTSDEVSIQMDEEACMVDGFSGRNTIGISGEFLSESVVSGLELMGDCLKNPRFDKDETAREKEIFKNGIEEEKSNGRTVAFRAFSAKLFGKHPYGRPLYGSASSIGSISTGNLTAYHDYVVTSSKMVLAIVGGISVDDAVYAAEEYFSIKKDFKKKKTPAMWDAPKSSKLVVSHVPGEQTHLVVGFKGVSLTDKARFSTEVMLEILGGHGGHLFESIREQESLAYTVSASSLEGIEPGYISFYAATSPGNEQQVYSLIMEDLERLKKHGPTKEEVERVVSVISGARQIAGQRFGAQAADLSLGYLYGFGVDFEKTYVSGIKAVTASSIKKTARQFLDIDKMIVSCAGKKPDITI